MKQITYLFSFFMFFLWHTALPTVMGSDTMVSLPASVTFPQSGNSTNRIAQLAAVQSGFAFQNNLTAALFDSVFPAAGIFQLNGGDLTLNRDLIFQNSSNFYSLGRIDGNGHVFSLSQTTTGLPSSTYAFNNAEIYLNNDLTITSTITFKNCAIYGNGFQLILGNSQANIWVANGSNLILKNLVLRGVNNKNIQCLNDRAGILLDDVTWLQSGSFTFTTGAFEFKNNVNLGGTGVFAYTSNQTSTIDSYATLQLDQGFTFSYDQVRSTSKNLLYFVDNTGILFLNGATLLTTTTGLTLTTGSLVVRGLSALSTRAQSGITFGNENASQDFACRIMAGSRLQLTNGSLNYRNSNASSWLMEDGHSTLYLGQNTTLNLYNTLNLGYGLALCDVNSTIAREVSAQLLGSVSAVGNLNFQQLS